MINFILFFVFLCSSALLQCSDASSSLALEEPITKPLPFASNGLFIFLDHQSETGDKIGSIGSYLIEALDQQAGPILASTLLVRDIVKQPTAQQFVDRAKKAGDPNAQLYQNLLTHRKEVRDYLQTSTPINPTVEQQNKIVEQINSLDSTKEMLKEAEKFPNDFTIALEAELHQFRPNSDEWIIKKVNDHLLFLVPKKYLEQLKEKNNFAQYYSTFEFTENELNLGIKIDHFDSIDFDTFIDKYAAPAKRDRGAFFIDYLETIFITRAECAKQKPVSFHMPEWFFYLVGHGLSGKVIADIAIDSFKHLLDFFDTKIITKLFIYNSCYAAGQTAQNLYKDAKSALFKSHSFIIVTGALTDAPTTKYTLVPIGVIHSTIDFEKKTEKSVNLMQYREFLEKVATENIFNFQILTAIFPVALIKDPRFIFDVPQIKLPGLEWFTIADIGNKVVSIGQTLATSRSADQPLDIMKFFGRKSDNAPIGILLYANVVPFELIINSSEMPVLVPMIPGNSYYELAKITTNSSLENFVKAISQLKKIYDKKEILIKKLRVKGILEGGTDTAEFENVFIKISLGYIDIYLTTKENTRVQWNWDNNELEEISFDYTISIKKIGIKDKERLEKTHEKMQAAERIRKVQENKIRTIEQERKTHEAAEQKEKKELYTKKSQLNEKFHNKLGRVGISLWVDARDRSEKNNALREMGKSISANISSRKNDPKESQEHLINEYDNALKELKLFFDEFTGEYAPEVRQEVEKKLEDFKHRELVTVSAAGA